MTNVLDPSALLDALPRYLTAEATLRQPQDALTALTHTILSLLGFRLVGVDDSSARGTFNDNVLPDDWAAHGPGGYALRYTHEQSSLEFVVKVSKLGSRTVINAIATETDKTATLDIATNDFVSPSFFPHVLGAADRSLVHGFISSNRVADFVSQFKLMIIQKLVPGLRKEGYSEETDDASTNSTSRPGQSSRDNQRNPFIIPERPQLPPGFASGIPGRNPLEIGRNDVFPDALRNPFTPPPLFPNTGGDGMFVGPDHPIFGPRQGQRSPGGLGPWGGDGFLPPMGAPPGARFDPIFPGPLGPRVNLPGRGGRAPQRSGDPDNDAFMPPGSGDMFM